MLGPGRALGQLRPIFGLGLEGFGLGLATLALALCGLAWPTIISFKGIT